MTRKVAFLTHPDCRLHTCDGHPEHANRTVAIEQHFRETGLIDQLIPIEPREATVEELALVHDRDYIKEIFALNPTGLMLLDPDTYLNQHSRRAALLSYGGALTAVDCVMSGVVTRAFCCLRPPGHHAEHDRSMGFCLFDNIAGAARYAQKKHKLARIAIIDFDVHHGNGTQNAFYDDPTVHFTSLHQWPFYPGSGSIRETGQGRGIGFTLNIPLDAGTSGKAAIERFQPLFSEAMEDFQPQIALISAGFDAHSEDPLASLNFEDEDYGTITRAIVGIADRYCDGKVVSLLEGGYNLEALARSAFQHVKGLVDG